MGFYFEHATYLEKEVAMLETLNVSQQKRRPVLKHPIKLTALLYLKEALAKQKYELCEEIISVAKEYGAADFEVRDLLEDPRRTPG